VSSRRKLLGFDFLHLWFACITVRWQHWLRCLAAIEIALCGDHGGLPEVTGGRVRNGTGVAEAPRSAVPGIKPEGDQGDFAYPKRRSCGVKIRANRLAITLLSAGFDHGKELFHLGLEVLTLLRK
jgi:hypothetical protein